MAEPFSFEEHATRDQVWLRAFLMGPTGSGKSRGALELAKRMFDGKLKISLINTERGRGKMYADRYDFQYLDLSAGGDYAPENYTKALDYAVEKNPGGVIIIDSASHEWMGNNGILSQADRFGDWKVVRPKHNAWVEHLMGVNAHVIVTVRAKMKYEVGEEETGGRKRQVIRMLGVGPIQSDDLQYEFNLVGRFEQETHDVAWSGHVDHLIEKVSNFADEESAAWTAEVLTMWLAEGNPLPEPPEAATDAAVDKLVTALAAEGFTADQIERNLERIRTMPENMGVLPKAFVAKATKESKARSTEAKAKASEPASDEVEKQEEDSEKPSEGDEPTGDAEPAEPAGEPEEPSGEPGEGESQPSEEDLDKFWEESGATS